LSGSCVSYQTSCHGLVTANRHVMMVRWPLSCM